MVDFKMLTDNYFKDKCALNPLEATMDGQNEYNDQLVFEMTDAFREKQGKFFEKYQSELTGVDTTRLTPEEKNKLPNHQVGNRSRERTAATGS